jgi:hypothetical protein
MLALAIPMDTDSRGNTIIETNAGHELKARRWPQDCEFQLVAFGPASTTCQIVWPAQLAEDIATALQLVDRLGNFHGAKPDWYRRLHRYSKGIGLRRRKRSQR